MRRKRFVILFVVLLTVFSINAQTISIEITNIRNNKGKIRLAVFKDNNSFKKEKGFIEKIYPKTDLKNGSMTVKINLEPGTYGISILDDENNDGKMEYRLIRIPKEGYGFSDYYHTGMSRPKFEDFDFFLGNNDKIVKIKIRYL